MSVAPASGRLAVLAGTDRQPEMRLFFERGEKHAATGEDLIAWVKRAPRRRWDRDLGCWIITAFGGTDATPRDPDRVLARAGFQVVLEAPGTDPSLRGVLSLLDLVEPLCRQSKARPAIALVRPRFAGWDVCRNLLGDAAIWDREHQRFEVPLTELLRHGEPKPGLVIDADTLAAARAALLRKPTFGSDQYDDETLAGDAADVAYSTGIDLTEADEEKIARLVEVVGDVPDWFRLDLYPYQRLGAIAAVAGRNFIADETGLGKTRQALAALAIRDVDRAVLVVPPVVLTNWARETEQAGLAVPAPKPPRKKTSKKKTKKEIEKEKILCSTTPADADRRATEPTAAVPVTVNEGTTAVERGRTSRLQDPLAPPSTASETSGGTIVTDTGGGGHIAARVSPRHLVVFRPGRKEPDLPERGIVVIADSLLTSRPQLRERIAAWQPTGLVVDEAHRARNWKAARAQALRALCDALPAEALRLPMTATPLFCNPAELASVLAISGHLDPVFGGYSAFISRYCKRNHFNALVPNRTRLPELMEMLRDRVWVRRMKAEVLKDLPTVSTGVSYVDVDLAGFKQAHNEVIDKVGQWVEEFVAEHDVYPDDDTVQAYSRTQIGLMSPLRKAAGLAKVPVALDYIADWIANEVQVNADGTFTCDRPLLIWAHHHEVVEAIVAHAAAHLKDHARGMVGVIAGNTNAERRGHYVDEFQAGRLPVLICSITAAGVGITLTRGSDQLHIESDYSPPIVSQAIDRQNRIGQTRPVNVTFLIAEGTLDARIHEILQTKGEVINAVLGGDSGTISPVEAGRLDDSAAPSEIIADLVGVAISRHKKGTRTAA